MNIHKLQYKIAPGLSRNRDDNRPLAQVDPGIALEPIIGRSHNVTIPVCPEAEDVERRVAGGLRTKQGLHMAGTDGFQQRVPRDDGWHSTVSLLISTQN